MVRWSTALILVGSLAVVGCGSSTSSSAPSVAPGSTSAATGTTHAPSSAAATPSSGSAVACSIVARADVEAAFGGTSSDGVAGKTPAYCDFTLTGTLKSGKAVGPLGATVTVWWDKYALDPNSKVLNASATTVPELGTAFYEPLGNALMVAYHGGTLNYQAHGPDDDETIRAEIIALAKATMSR